MRPTAPVDLVHHGVRVPHRRAHHLRLVRTDLQLAEQRRRRAVYPAPLRVGRRRHVEPQELIHHVPARA